MYQLNVGPALSSFITLMCAVPLDDPRGKHCRWGVPVYLEGAPGLGKSVGVETAAKALGLCVETIYPSTRMPEDFNEILFPDGKGGVSMTSALVQVKSLHELGRGVLFLDEATLAVRAVQNAMMSVVWNRTCGGLTLPGGVRVILAANAAASVGGEAFSTALYNRMATVLVKAAPVKKWSDYMQSVLERDTATEQKDVVYDAIDIERRVRDNWKEALALTTAQVSAFLKGHPQHLEETEDTQGVEVAWASPRSWETATRALATYHALQEDSAMLQKGCIESIVGINSYTAFSAFLRQFKLPTVEDVILGKWHPSPVEVDVAAYVVNSLNAAAMQTLPFTSEDVAKAYIRVIDEYCEATLADVAYKLTNATNKLVEQAGTKTVKDEFRELVKRRFVLEEDNEAA